MNFEQACSAVKQLKTLPGETDLLRLYALYKQATEGDCTTRRPGMFDIKGQKKWSAWQGVRGVSTESAKSDYVRLVRRLISAH